MLITARNIQEIRKQHERIVGFYGAPPQDLLLETAKRCDAPLLDLDVHYDAPCSSLVPDAYCHIIRNCVDNAVALQDRLVSLVAATGKEKCDAGRFAGVIIRESTDIDVIAVENHFLTASAPPLLSEMRGSLKKRVIAIMRGIVEPADESMKLQAMNNICEPTHGFWGTPPHPIELLDLFPDTTHVFGWTRCVEQGRPSDLDLEMEVPAGLPIVFFSQGFCPKAQLAKFLAERNRGMHVDVHDSINAATMAKIEAFIRLATREGR